MSGAFSWLGQKLSPRSVVDWRQLTGAAIIGVTLAACAATGSISKESPAETKQAAVTQRANARWQAIIDGDVAKSYGMLSAGSKATTSLEAYQRKARLKGFSKAEVQSAECTAEICKVTVKVALDARKVRGFEVPEIETWILEKGEYWYVFPF
jgi:hypothetical protein